jgi:hypothetical protein
MSDEWIKITDSMPPIDKEISLKIESFAHDVVYWRYLTEKRPDFGKLNIGDKLIIEIMPNDSKGSKVIEYFGYFQGISEANMFEISINTYSFIGDCISVSRVKKITRINIEKQTFEEINHASIS